MQRDNWREESEGYEHRAPPEGGRSPRRNSTPERRRSAASERRTRSRSRTEGGENEGLAQGREVYLQQEGFKGLEVGHDR